MVRELISRWRSDSGPIYATLNLLSLSNPSYASLYADIYRDHYAALEAVIAEAMPGLSRKEYELRARLLSSLIDGTPYQKQKHRREFTTRVVAEAVKIALDG